jgi:aspergillopepsin I
MVYHFFILSLLAGIGSAVPINDDSSPESGLLRRGQSTASVAATLTQGIEWLVPIQVANKTYNVQLDTGSADL